MAIDFKKLDADIAAANANKTYPTRGEIRVKNIYAAPNGRFMATVTNGVDYNSCTGPTPEVAIERATRQLAFWGG